ncbi:MAG: hypothetical protein IPP26_09280 [Flavobacteriales bacterium]|nr:hypothetical protein [Flavobacteriales bacterium]
MRAILILSFVVISWPCRTRAPGNNYIDNFRSVSLYLKDGQQLDDLERWYFYKGCVIGELSDSKGWFVVEEAKSEVIWHTDRLKWEALLKERDLIPSLWTRWFDGDPAMLTSGMFWFLWIVTSWYAAIPILLLVVMVFRRAWKREHFNWRRPYTMGTIAIGLFVLSRIVLENWLGSI